MVRVSIPFVFLKGTVPAEQSHSSGEDQKQTPRTKKCFSNCSVSALLLQSKAINCSSRPPGPQALPELMAEENCPFLQLITFSACNIIILKVRKTLCSYIPDAVCFIPSKCLIVCHNNHENANVFERLQVGRHPSKNAGLFTG